MLHKCVWRAGERAQDLGAQPTLPEDPGSENSIHMVTHHSAELQLQGIQLPLLASAGTALPMGHRHTSRPNTHIHKMRQ